MKISSQIPNPLTSLLLWIGNEPNEVAFMKVKIGKVLTLSDWRINPSETKRFSHNLDSSEYAYWDYITAWTNLLFQQNKNQNFIMVLLL